jgi:putative sigma-54 modulation protein
MISRVEVAANGIELTDDIKKYIDKKIGRLDRYMSKHARKSVHAEVKLKQEKSKKKDKLTAEVILHMPGGNLTAKEATLNIYAAIDIVESKLKNQLKKYKDKHEAGQKADRKGALKRLRDMADRDYRGSQN